MKWLMPLIVFIVILLHQDFWNWTNRSLVFGFLPVGLAYHAFYSILASVTMALLVRFCWPAHLDDADEDETVPTSGSGASAAVEGNA
jgi:hypothetical protein